MAQAVRRWPLSVEDRIHSRPVHVGHVADEVAEKQFFFLSTSALRILHLRISLIYHRRYTLLATANVSVVIPIPRRLRITLSRRI